MKFPLELLDSAAAIYQNADPAPTYFQNIDLDPAFKYEALL